MHQSKHVSIENGILEGCEGLEGPFTPTSPSYAFQTSQGKLDSREFCMKYL